VLVQEEVNTQLRAEEPTLSTSNSRPQTAQGAPPSLDLTTPDIQIILLLRMTFKTPSNMAELGQLKDLFKQSQINQNLLFEKAIKAAQYGFAKSIVTEVTNQDLVNAADEARKKRNKVAGKNGKARVMDEEALEAQLRLEFEVYWTASIYGKPIVSSKNTSLVYNLGLSKIKEDIFTWEITLERKKAKNTTPKTPSNQSTIQPVLRPKKQTPRASLLPSNPRSPPLLGSLSS
jgi:hypothetical protein